MSRTEAELESEMARASQLDTYEAQQAALENVVQHADAGGYHRLAFAARRSLADAYCVGRQWDKAFPLFARCLSDYDRRTGDYGPEEDWALRQWYTRIAVTMAEFPEISLAQISQVFDDMEHRFRTAGHNLRNVYEARQAVAMLTGDWDGEERWYQQWLAAGGPQPGNVWDFEIGIERLLRRGDSESVARALELAAPVLTGQLTFTEPPLPIWCLMLLPLVRAGESEQAAKTFWRAFRQHYETDRVYRYEYSGMMLEFCALTGNEWKGREDLKRRLTGFYTLNRPNGKMEFAASVAVLCRELVESGLGASLLKPLSVEELYLVLALGEQMRGIALDLAERFDQRNGNTAVGDRIRARLAVPRVTGQLDLGPGLPGSRPPRTLARLPPIPHGTPGQALIDRAEWHYRRKELGAAAQHLAAIRDPSPQVAARAAFLRAVLSWNTGPGAGKALEQAAQALHDAGDQVRHLLCLAYLGAWQADKGGQVRQGLMLLAQADRQLGKAGDQRSFAVAERLAAILLRRHAREGKQQGWRAVRRALRQARACGDRLLEGEVLLTASNWQRSDYPRKRNGYSTTARKIFTGEQAPVKIVEALEEIRLGHLQAGTMDQFSKLIGDECARWPPDAPPEMLGYLRYQRGRGLIAAGRPADAVDDLRYALAEARSRDAEDPYQVYYLAVACHAAGLHREAAGQLDRYLYWLDNLRLRGELAEPDIDQRAHALLAECRRALGEQAGVA